MMTYLLLFINFFNIGLFSFGGGYTMMPLLQKVVIQNGWMTEKGFADMIAISQMTPGPIAINMATYVGFQTKGVPGSLVATVAVTLPAFIIICIIGKLLLRFNENPFVKSVFYGLRPAVMGLIAAAAYNVALVSIINMEMYETVKTITALIDLKAFLLTLAIMLCIYKYKEIHPIAYIGAAGIFGMLFM